MNKENMSNKTVSYPKSKIKILLLENVHSSAFNKFAANGFNVEHVHHSMGEDELIEKIKGVHILGVRSKTKVTKRVLDHADKLMAVGAFCIGTTQIDKVECCKNGIAVFNAPYSNSRSVVELAIGNIIMLMRSIIPKNKKMHAGIWDKSATGSYEVRGKILGIVGYGNIGSQLSVIAESMGMHVHYYDINEKLTLGNAYKCNTLNELLNISDVVSLHVDDNPANKNLISDKEIRMMKKNSMLINLSRGSVVDLDALSVHLKSGHISGAAIDVFQVEPLKNGEFTSILSGQDNVILTPHIGGNTMEAQKNIASFVPNKLIEYINSGGTVDSVNFPIVKLPTQENTHRFLHIHKNVGGVLSEINATLSKYDISISGQYLSTNDDIGYVIFDTNKSYDTEILTELKNLDNTIKFRILY